MSASTNISEDTIGLVRDLLAHYKLRSGVYDELLEPDGSIKPTWQPLIAHFATLGPEELRAAKTGLERILQESHVTFVAQDENESTSRPWRLDLFPFLISPSEWRFLEQGLIQRATLLNQILVDLYGEQRVLNEGKLPSGLVFGSGQFLRPCSNLRVRRDQHLYFLAFDVARSPDGQWWVLSDRTEAPSGAGYTLENRIVTSRSLPELFVQQNVQRHASFFRAFNEHFMSMAERDEPHAVFLSRGPAKRTYFEHAYLARYLGYTIVEGSDLAVRNERLYLKTVQGLRPIDLVMRTVRSEMCDPLELRTDATSGVPGLLQAVRAGRVVFGNALGSGLVESDAFLSFLPMLCRYYLGEDLTIPSVATWWCGQDSAREYVLANLEELVVRRISSTRSLLAQGQDGRIDPSEIDALREAITQRGYDYIGQETVTLSTAPTWADDGTLRAAPIALRFFVAATADGFKVMPGALTRVSVQSDAKAAWLSASDISKDTWVLSDQPVDAFSLLAQRFEGTWLRRSTGNLPSRAADNLFWLGRYAERAEGAVRLLRSLVWRFRGETGSAQHAVSPTRLIGMLVAHKHISSRNAKRAIQQGRDAIERELWSVLFDPESPDGLPRLLGNVQRNADVVRERLSSDAYRILTDLTNIPRSASSSERRDFDDVMRLLNELIQHLAGFSGMAMENMTRGDGWRFLDMGRRIERMRAIARLVQQLAVRGDPEHDGSLELLLELADSRMTFLNRYHSPPQLPRVVDLLFADESNPRSAVFQVVVLAGHLANLARNPNEGILSDEQRITTRLASNLRLADVFEIAEKKSRFGSRIEIDRLARQVERGANDISDHVSRTYFSHSAPHRISAGERRREPR
jgi:uncharacterized circularly permuted ATP-grasp superfamily protein/uncharacterized alpha-E superfamily protein